MTIINKLSVLLSVWLCMACSSSQDTVSDVSLTDYVEPRIGTAHCRWFHFTPGALPFGLAKPGPSTNGHIGNKWVGKLRVTTIVIRLLKVSLVCMNFRWEVSS